MGNINSINNVSREGRGKCSTGGDSKQDPARPAPPPQAKQQMMDSPAMTPDEKQVTLPPVADVLLNQLLNNITDENNALREENEGMEAVHESLTTLKIYIGDEEEIVVDLSKGLVIPDVPPEDAPSWDENGNNCLCAIPFYTIPGDQLIGKSLVVSLHSCAEPVLLSDLIDIKVHGANEAFGGFFGIQSPILVDESGPNPVIGISRDITIQGKISGLSDADMELFMDDGDLCAEKIAEYIHTGDGLEGGDITFTPYGFFMDITPDVKKILDILDPLCRGNLLLGELTEHEVSRATIISAIGGSEIQQKVLNENTSLKLKNNALTRLSDILGTVKFPHSSGALSVHLKEGSWVTNSGQDELFWAIDTSGKENFALLAKDATCYDATLSGIPTHIVPPILVQEPEDGINGINEIRMKYENGILIYGTFDSSVDLDDADFSTCDALVTLTKIVLPVRLVIRTLDMLGIDYLGGGK